MDGAGGARPIVPRRGRHGVRAVHDDLQAFVEGVLRVDDGAVDAIDLLDPFTRHVEGRAMADAVGHGADVAAELTASGCLGRPARAVRGGREEHHDRLVDAVHVADGGRRAGRGAVAAGNDDLHPATTVGAEHGGREVVLHGVQDAARFGLRGKIRDRAVIDTHGVGRDGHDGQDDHHHDGGGDHDLEEGEAGAKAVGELAHRLMTIFCTSRGVTELSLNTAEST